jgi:hypothetical protein
LDQTIPRQLRNPCSQELIGSIRCVKRIRATLPTLSLKHQYLMQFSVLHHPLTRGLYPSYFSMWNLCLFIIFYHYIHVAVHRNRFLLNNRPDTPIIQIYSVIKLYMFRGSSLPIIRSCSSILSLLRSGHHKPAWNLPVPNVQ